MLYSDIVKENIPTRKAKVCSNSLPWMNSKIRKLMNQRYKKLKKANKQKNPDDRNAYKKLRNEVERELRTAETCYWNQKVKEAKEGSANFWNTIKTLTKTKGKKEKVIGPLMERENLCLMTMKKQAL